MNAIETLELLDGSPCGVYAVDSEQKIIYWNRAAEEILGHKRAEVIGLRCYEVCASLPQNGAEPICIEGCPSLALARQGVKPPVTHVQMRCSSGKRKQISVIPLVVQTEREGGETIVAHLFHDQIDDAGAEKMAESVRSLIASDDDHQSLAPRELEALRLAAQSLEIPEIAARMGISAHTVRDHIRNARKRLNAKNRMEAVLIAQSRGLL